MLGRKYLFIELIIVIGFVVQIETVTVNPLCPTNKIAPRKRVPRFENSNPRTFGAFYNLLTPGSTNDVPSSLAEVPQADEPDDCGDIEDYDEHDLSSVTPHSTRRQGYADKRLHHHHNHGSYYLQHYGLRPTVPPKKPTRPPTGGYFGTNSYTPPKPQEPTDHLKPVHEPGHEQHMTYRPGIVGAPSSHVVGLPQVKPTRHYSESTTNNKHYANYDANTGSQFNTNSFNTKQKYYDRPRRLHDDGIVRSFLDLFLK